MDPYASWTLNPHQPLEELADNLWYVSGTLNDGKLQRCMVLARLRDGRVLMHNPIALEEELMAKIDAWGELAAILVPNAWHRMDARIMKQRYPKARVHAPAGAAKAVGKIVPVEGSFADAPNDDTVRTRHLPGLKEREGWMDVRSGNGRSAVFCDALMNMKKLSGPMDWALGPTGTLSVPRVVRWFVLSDKAAFRAELEGAAEGLGRIIPGHGRVIEGAEAPLRAVIQGL